jgi:hypothetical protein
MLLPLPVLGLLIYLWIVVRDERPLGFQSLKRFLGAANPFAWGDAEPSDPPVGGAFRIPSAAGH